MTASSVLSETRVLLSSILETLVSIDVAVNALKPPHETSNTEKIKTFIKILSNKGWVGVPLVVGSRGNLLTGTHRFNAMKAMGWKDEQIPTINIKELCHMSGFDVKDLENKGIIKRGTLIFDEIRNKLSDSIRRKYKV